MRVDQHIIIGYHGFARERKEEWKNETSRKDVDGVREFGHWGDSWKSLDKEEEGEINSKYEDAI